MKFITCYCGLGFGLFHHIYIYMCGQVLSLKPGWSPIRELVTPTGAGTQNAPSVAEDKYRSTS